jgi:hypothetical protein
VGSEGDETVAALQENRDGAALAYALHATVAIIRTKVLVCFIAPGNRFKRTRGAGEIAKKPVACAGYVRGF